ncbi:hypothetical protein JCM1841_003340 [Sporobolomyces salmonicolor]
MLLPPLTRWVLAILLLLGASDSSAAFYSPQRKRELRDLAHETWRHAYGSYKRVAFPADELLPLSCAKQGHDRRNLDNVAVNDVMGDYALTLVDSLDTFAMLGDREGFEQAVRETIEQVHFDVDSRVQVFEVTIRMMGGLLAGHLLASPSSSFSSSSDNPSTFSSSLRGFSLPWYRSELLHLAHDLGRRLLPAFATPTGIPFARIHLQRGLRGKDGKGESGETCSAGAGSLLLEFITLSRLTAEPIFEQVARRAFFAVWNRRSEIGLIGNTVDARTGAWIHGVSSTGAGVDSFFEYAAKAYVLTGEDEYLRVWDEAYSALQRYVRAPDGFWYRGVNMHTGQLASILVDSLSAFFPGVQTLMGDLENAIKSHAVYAFQWKRFGGLPELFDTHKRGGAQMGYPLRPEFVESNMYLYMATKDDYYLSVAEQILHDLNNRTRVACGMAAVLDLGTGQLEDKMPSFVTSETLKYLYLTFDEENPFLTDDSAFVFTTEGHPLEIPHPPPRKRSLLSPPSSEPPPVCMAHDPLEDERYHHYLSLSVDRRTDWEHARWLAGFEVFDEVREVDEGRWSESGFCEISENEVRSPSSLLAPCEGVAQLTGPDCSRKGPDRLAPSFPPPPWSLQDAGIELLFAASPSHEVVAPRASQLAQLPSPSGGDVVVHAINGLRFSLVRATPGAEGYIVSKVGPYKVPMGAYVVIRDPAVLASIPRPRAEKFRLEVDVAPADSPPPPPSPASHGDEASRFDSFLDKLLHPLSESVPPTPPPRLQLSALAASFGPSLSSRQPPPNSFAVSQPALPVTTSLSSYGCEPHHPAPPSSSSSSSSHPSAHDTTALEGHLLLVHRGHCSFARKSHLAALAGAAGVIVINSAHEDWVVPSAAAEDEHDATRRSLVPVVLVANGTGAELEELVRTTRARGAGDEVWVSVEEEAEGDGDAQGEDEDELVEGMVLGGYWTRNVKLPRRR